MRKKQRLAARRPPIELTERAVQIALFISMSSAMEVMVPNFQPRRWSECDLWCVTRAGYVVEHEVKLTVADFKADAVKTLGASGFNKHAALDDHQTDGPSRFFFVVPDGLIQAGDVPDWAGLKYVRNTRGHTSILTAKNAPRLHRIKADRDEVKRAVNNCYWRYWRLAARTAGGAGGGSGGGGVLG